MSRSSPWQWLALSLGLALAPAVASADRLTSELDGVAERGFAPVQELSYETIVEPSSSYDAVVRIRTALHNDSARPRDAVLALALPLTSEITGLRVARDGTWADGAVTQVSTEPGPRDPGTVFVRPMAPELRGDLPGAEVVAFGLEPGSTVQVELSLRVFPRLRGERWELDMPARGRELRGLAPQRRVTVKDVPEFWVEDGPNGDAPVLLSRGDYEATVAWPASIRNTGVFDGRYEVTPDNFGGGSLKVLLRLGPTRAPRPDHLAVVMDRSRSTSPHMQRETVRVTDALLDSLPASATFDAVGFSRGATALLDGDGPIPKADEASRTLLRHVMDRNRRDQGTDLAAGLELAITRMARTGARRPMIVVFTDGMLPTTVSPGEVRERVERALDTTGVRSPEILFVVDEPLWHLGVSTDRPIARVAAALGARISHKSLAGLHPEAVQELLASPQVLGQLAVDLPEQVRLRHEIPAGLVAGGFAVIDGSYTGQAPRSVRVTARLGNKKVARRLKLRKRAAPPAALVASSTADVAAATKEGFSLPGWYGKRDQRLARLGITDAGRGGAGQRGLLTPSILQHYLRTRVWPRARVCYNHAVARNQVQGGRVVLQLEVGKGEVMMARPSSIDLESPDAAFIECLTEAGWALDVPAAQLDDRTYLVHYPLRFDPPKNGRPPSTTDPLGKGTIETLLGTGRRSAR